MKKYSEEQGEKVFDWNAFLNRDEKDYTSQELDEATQMSRFWVTCACGQQCDIIPRNIMGSPKDRVLEELGLDFTRYIERMNGTFDDVDMFTFAEVREKAKLTLEKIEQRSAKLIEKLTK
jgi:hypothetical protein